MNEIGPLVDGNTKGLRLATDPSREEAFHKYRQGVIGRELAIRTPYGEKPLLYADWTATGRLYAPLEQHLLDTFGPYAANTHSSSNRTGAVMTEAYAEALKLIKKHVHADELDAVLAVGTGMTGAINKLQRMLGLRNPNCYAERPVIFITHMEHHSNQISWMETIGETVIVPPGPDGLVHPERLDALLQSPAYRSRAYKIGAFTACSNVTGLATPYRSLARIMHEHGGICIIDFAASAPYDPIDMHPPEALEKLDAIVFSPHKCLGGPGSSGILVFDKRLCRSMIPDQPGGGTVWWTDPWGRIRYLADVEAREDGGTPGVLQTIRAALSLKLKEDLDPLRMKRRKDVLLARLWEKLADIPGLHVLEGEQKERHAIVSFVLEQLPYPLVVRLLNDRFGIQARGGCSCAGTYGHYLLHLGKGKSDSMLQQLSKGDLTAKPGWVRISLHPIMTDAEVDLLGAAIQEIGSYGTEWKKDYRWQARTGEYRHYRDPDKPWVNETWFSLEDAERRSSTNDGEYLLSIART